MGMENLFSWILSFITTMAPIEEPAMVPEAHETEFERTRRYHQIALDLIDVAYDPSNTPLFDGVDGRSHTVAIMLGIMFHESKFRKHIDFALGPNGRGDRGKSWCLMQVMAGRRGRTSKWNVIHDRPYNWGDPHHEIRKGFTGKELVKDRRLCFQEGLKIARLSFSRCGYALENKLRVYASGSCKKGIKESRHRIYTAERFWSRTKGSRSWNDSDIIRLVVEKMKKEHTFLAQLLPSEAIDFSQNSEQQALLFPIEEQDNNTWEFLTPRDQRSERGKFIGLKFQ